MKRFLAVATLLALLSPTVARAGLIPDGGFESPSIGINSYSYNTTGGEWTFTGNSGLINGSSAFGNTTPLEGSQVGFLQTNANQGAGVAGNIAQYFTVGAGAYSLSLLAETRAGYAPSSFIVQFDGVTIATISPTSSSLFSLYGSSQFTVASTGSHLLALISTGPSDSTSFVDNIMLNAVVPEPASFAMLGFGLIASGAFYAKKARRNRN